ncbi:MAG: IclR family transcriptional regulator [Neomegalonema sp.]|nr:IclR family transcriptional regulator [Neomegalonema sp.]
MRESIPKEAKRVPALDRGVQILDFVAGAEIAPNATEICKKVGIAKSSAHGLLSTLCELGLLVRRGDQTYSMGPHVARWGAAFERQTDIGREFAQIWDTATTLPGATITLSVLEGDRVVYIGARNSGATPWVDFRIGMSLPAAFTATGMAIMSRMSNAEIRAQLSNGLPAPLTPYSVRTIDDVLENVAAARAHGLSIDQQQTREGMICLGAPILNAQGRAIAGVAVSFPVEEFDDLREQLTKEIKAIAETLSARMGGG